MYFHTISCCLTCRISPLERRGILIRKQKSKQSNSHLVKFKRFLHVFECNLASTWKKLLNSIYSDTDVPCQWLSITSTPSVYVVVLTL